MSAPLGQEEDPVETLCEAGDAIKAAIRRAERYVRGCREEAQAPREPEELRVCLKLIASATVKLGRALDLLTPDDDDERPRC